MRNLMRLTYAANRRQAWEDWLALRAEVVKLGKEWRIDKPEPTFDSTLRQIDVSIGHLQEAMRQEFVDWDFVLPGARG